MPNIPDKHFLPGIDHFFAFLHSLPLPEPEHTKWEDAYFVTLEKSNTANRPFFVHVTHLKQIDQPFHKKQLFSATELKYNKLFCKPETNSNGEKCRLKYEGQYYFARPLSFWLSPVAFFLFPLDKLEQWENFIKRCEGYIQSELYNLFESKVLSDLSVNALFAMPDEAFKNDLLVRIKPFLVPREWQMGNTRPVDYAIELFSQHSDTLSLRVFKNEQVNFFMPPTDARINGEVFGWEYEKNRLQFKKTLLTKKIEHLSHRYNNLYNDLKAEAFENNSLPTVQNYILGFQESMDGFSKEIKNIEYYLSQSRTSSGTNEKKYCFYPNSSSSFAITFEGQEIAGMKQQASKIIHILLSNPNKEYDMYDLYMVVKKESVLKKLDEEINSNDKRQILEYLETDLISPKEVEEEIKRGNTQEIKTRLEGGKRLLTMAKSAFPDFGWDVYLRNYENLYDRLEDDFSVGYEDRRSLSQKPSHYEHKSGRQRISKQLVGFYSELCKNIKYSKFHDFLHATIKRESENGIHYYTFRPGAASKKEWREANWILEP